jgi:hypothetical protein
VTTTGGSRFLRAVDNLPRERLAELVSAAAYGSALVLAALSVIGVSEVSVGHGAELVAGVGVATWIAHLFAEVLGEHVRAPQPVGWSKVKRAMADGSPILVASILPALVLLLGRLDVMSPRAARVIAIVITIGQLLAVGILVARVANVPTRRKWLFAAATLAIGIVVVTLSVLLGH